VFPNGGIRSCHMMNIITSVWQIFIGKYIIKYLNVFNEKLYLLIDCHWFENCNLKATTCMMPDEQIQQMFNEEIDDDDEFWGF